MARHVRLDLLPWMRS